MEQRSILLYAVCLEIKTSSAQLEKKYILDCLCLGIQLCNLSKA